LVFYLQFLGVLRMPSEIKIISTSAKGQEKTFTYKPGAKHLAISGADIKFMVDGKPGLPAGTKVVRKGKSVQIDFPDGQSFEVADWSDAPNACLMNLDGAQALDAKTGQYVAVKTLSSRSFGMACDGTSAAVLGEAAAASASGGFNPVVLAPLALLAAAGGGGGGGGGGSTSNPDNTALARIANYAEKDGVGTAVLSESDFRAAGVTGVTAENLAAINSALATAKVTGADADTAGKVQALVNAYSKILGEANGATPDASVADPSAADYAAIGANVGTAATDPDALKLLNDVIGGKNPADVDTPAEIAALAAIVDKVMNAAAGGTPLPTAAELAAIGLTGVTPENLPAVLAALAATPDDGSGVSNLADLQTLANTAAADAAAAAAKIAGFADNNTQPAPGVTDYAKLGVKGVTPDNLAAINSAVDALTGPKADTAAEVQALVDAYTKILGEANGAAPDATPADPTPADYAAIGANIGTAATDPEALALLNDVIGGKNPADIDTLAEIAALAAIVDKVMNAAAGGTPLPTAAELAAIGLTGVTPANLAAVLAALAATPDDGSGVDTLGELQAVTEAAVAAVAAAQNKLVAYADDNTQPAPTVADYAAIGVTGVDASNLPAINSAIDALTGSGVDTPAEVQALADAYNKILSEANGAAPDATPADPTAADYAAIGANIGTAATDAEALGLLNDAVGGQPSTGVDTPAEIAAIAAAVDKVMNAVAGGTPAPSVADLTALGITGVTDANLPSVLAALAATADDGSDVTTLANLQALTDSAAGGPVAAAAKILAYANDNTSPAPNATDYLIAGVTGVNTGNLGAINAAVDALSGPQVDTPAQLQALVDAYTKILGEANGATPDATPADPTAADYAAIGANIGTAATDPEALALLNDVIGGKTAADVDTPAEIAALAAIVDKVLNAAAGGTPLPTAAELAAIGVTGVTPENLPAILAAIAATPDDGSGVDALSELQAVTDAAAAAAAAAQSVIVAYANDNTQPAPSVTDLTALGVTGVDASNLPAINSAIDALTGTGVDTVAEVQALADAYNKILGEANGATPDATPADPTAADYAAIGANIGTAATDPEALALLNDVIGGKTAADVDTPAEIAALAAIVDKVMNAAAGGTPAPTAAELAAIGLTGVTPENLAAVLAAIAATPDDGSGVDALSELQAVADAAVAAAAAAQAKIVAYADDNTQATPALADYAAAGVTGVNTANLSAINSAIDTLTGTQVDTRSEWSRSRCDAGCEPYGGRLHRPRCDLGRCRHRASEFGLI
jgi:hypothetical protein